MFQWFSILCRGSHDRMVDGFTTTNVISAYHHWSCEFDSRSWRGVLDTTLCDKVCQWLATCWWFSPVLLFPPPVKLAPQYRRDIVESGVKHHNRNPCILSSRESCWPIHIFFYGCVHMPPQKVPCLDFNSKSNA
jgi:hypothetical protein